jgi:hypothetical protein
MPAIALWIMWPSVTGYQRSQRGLRRRDDKRRP